MATSLAVIGTLLLSSSIFGFLPDKSNSEGLSDGELFLTPLAADYSNGFSIYYAQNNNKIIGEDNLLSLDLAKSFSIRRWYFKNNNILEIGGGIGAKNYFVTPGDSSTANLNSIGTNELLSVGSDYIISNHIGYLLNNLVFRLSWNYESKQSARQFEEYLAEAPNEEQRGLANDQQGNPRQEFSGDTLEILIADVRELLRYYIGLGTYSTINQDISDRRFARIGFDYRGNQSNIRLVFGGEALAYGYNNGDISYRALVGFEKSKTPVDGWRVSAILEEGPSTYGPYYDNGVSSLGIKATRFF